MDNQHPSPEQGKVQRLSRKRVLDNSIIWETPTNMEIAIYHLRSSRDTVTRYVGATRNPRARLSQHTAPNSAEIHNQQKYDWICKEMKEGYTIMMIIVNTASTIQEALIIEQEEMTKYSNLLNIDMTPTKPQAKKCYLYDWIDDKNYTFESLTDCSRFVGITPIALTQNHISKNRYVFSYTDVKEKMIEVSTIKAKNIKTNEIRLFLTQEHAARQLGCSISMVNWCIMRERKSAKGWQLIKVDEEFIDYTNNHYKKVQCINDGILYSQALDASKYYGVDASMITKICKGIRPAVKGLKFIYVDDIVQL